MSLDGLPLSRKQIVSIVESRRYRISIWSGAVRSGKTIASILAFYDAIVNAPTSGLIVIAGRTLQTIERNILDPMQDESKFGEWAHEVHHTPGSNTAVIFGRTIHLIGASDVRAEGKLRGMTACLALVDEATLLPESFWTQLLARLSVPGARCLATTNPDNPSHFLKVNFIDRADDPDMNLRAWHFTLDDNPYLGAEYVAAIKAEFTGLFYLRNILGRWVAADGAIFDMYDPDRHVIPWAELPEMRWIIGVGVDHGTTNPTHAVMVGHGVDDVLYCMDEWRYKAASNDARWTNVQLSKGLRDWMALPHHPNDGEDGSNFHGYVIVDSSATDYRMQLKQDGVKNLVLAKKEVLYGIRTLTALVSAGRLKFTDRCPELLKEIPGYVWDTKATEKGKDEPIKLNDHGCFVAGTLVETRDGPRPIELIRPGELVHTRIGLRPVVASGQTGVLPVRQVELSDGTTLIGTGNHPVFVADQGFTPIDGLRYGDRLVSCTSVLKRSSSKASSSDGTRTPDMSRIAAISPLGSPTNSVGSSDSTKKSGWTSMALRKSLRAITSTISTTTFRTTTQPTSSVSLLKSTASTTPATSATTQSEWPGSELTSNASGHSPVHGTAVKRAGLGIASTADVPGKTESRRLPPVISAATNSNRCSPADSVLTTASQHGGDNPDSTTSIASARVAEQRSEPTSTAERNAAPVSVVSVSDSLAPQAVFNLTVAEQPEYFAGGVLVHNCDALRYVIVTTERKWRRQIKLNELPIPIESDQPETAVKVNWAA